jgi:hypothetical protein
MPNSLNIYEMIYPATHSRRPRFKKFKPFNRYAPFKLLLLLSRVAGEKNDLLGAFASLRETIFLS